MTPADVADINVPQTAKTLRDNIANLDVRDQSFASSLLAQLDRKGLSKSQLYWLRKLADKAIGVANEPERTKTQIGELKGIMELFDKAKEHLQKPAIVLAIEADEGRFLHVDRKTSKETRYDEYRINIAGERARVPGSLNVANTNNPSTWYGRVLITGEFEASPRDTTPTELIPGLVKFAAEPAKIASESGRLTGKCCFCNISLTDERSTAVGYGPICAKHYGLPWGSK
jgi:hypothetical protein